MTRNKKTPEQTKAEYHKNNKELMYLLSYYGYTNNKTDSYIFANLNDVTTNINSLKASASQYSRSVKVANIEPSFLLQFELACKRFLTNNGYTITTQSEQVQITTNDKTDDTKQIKTAIIEEETEQPKRKEKREDEIITKKDFSLVPDIYDNLDLGNKDDLLKELQRRYRLANGDDKVQNDISKMIIDVQNMKKQDIADDTQHVYYYFPLRQCEDCPNRKRFIENND